MASTPRNCATFEAVTGKVVYDMADLTGRSATREDIVAAYRLILLREPDEIGLKHYPTSRSKESFVSRMYCPIS